VWEWGTTWIKMVDVTLRQPATSRELYPVGPLFSTP
jgi:hypothetical protein